MGALYVAYSGTRLLADDDRSAAYRRAARIFSIERWLHVDFEHSLNRFFVQHDTIALLGCYYYSTAHYLVTLATLIWLYWQGRAAYIPARRVLVVATLLALGLYLLMPTAPPRFLPGFTDVLALHAHQGWWGQDASAPRGMGNLTNQLAAFPSLHAGWSLWVAIMVHKISRHRWLRALAWANAVATVLVILGTANHWVLDVAVGWSVVIVGYAAVAAVMPRSILNGVPLHSQLDDQDVAVGSSR